MNAKKRIFYGTGLGSFERATDGLGLDVLSLQLSAMKKARDTEADSVLHQLGTMGYSGVPEKDVQRVIYEQMKLFNKMSDNLGKLKLKDKNGKVKSPISLEHYLSQNHFKEPRFEQILNETCERLSEFHKVPGYDDISQYTALQTAQERRFIEDCGVFFQVGWNLGGNKTKDMDKVEIAESISKRRLNEHFFVQMLKYCYPNLKLGTEYVPADMDFETGNQRPPYTIFVEERRPRINERFSKFCADAKGLKCYDKGLEKISKKILLPFEDLFGEVPSSKKEEQARMIDKIDQIQDYTMGGRIN